jgi:hypothetical protein
MVPTARLAYSLATWACDVLPEKRKAPVFEELEPELT